MAEVLKQGQLQEQHRKQFNARNPYWDNLKGLLIICVVLGHFLWEYAGLGVADFFVKLIYLFHMPAFVFVAGYLSKSTHARSGQALLKLGLLYLIFNTGMMFFSSALCNTVFQLVTPYYSFWFLISLIVWRMTVKWLEKIEHIVQISLIAALFAGFANDGTNALAIERTIVFSPFFLMGYQLSSEKISCFLSKRSFSDYLKGFLLLCGTIALARLFIMNCPVLGEPQLLMQGYNSPVDFCIRIALFSLASLMILALLLCTPQKTVPFLSRWGKNTIVIFLLHRFVTLIFYKIFPAEGYNEFYLVWIIGASLLTLLILGSEFVFRIFNQVIDSLFASGSFLKKSLPSFKRMLGLVATVCLALLSLALLLSSFGVLPSDSIRTAELADRNTASKPIHAVLQKEQAAALEEAVSIAFVGDLILLQDQVRKAYVDTGMSEENFPGKYDFASMFQYAREYLSEADLAIGIFEGPMDGGEAGYSTSNYDDGLPLALNYPDAFAQAVKDAGIDLVSTANNHLLDKGEKGAERTLDLLDQVGLAHVGSYRNAQEKEKITILEVKGIRLAVLAYTFGSNGYKEQYFLKQNPTLTSILVDPTSRNFAQVKAQVLADFEKIKEMQNPPDLIVVLPHMGTQFSHQTDSYQDTWNEVFIQAGADIILGDHAHAVQPIEFRTKVTASGEKREAIIVNCPGNFANSYVKHNGDATAIVEVYLDPQRKEILCAGVIPMYTQAPLKGNHRALPIYHILHDQELQREISCYEFKRITEVQELISSVMLGAKLTIDQVQERHYLFPEGYFRQPVAPIELTEEMRATTFYKLLQEANAVCFVGDSITAGSENGGYGWYEPLLAVFPEKTVYREAQGGATTVTLLEQSAQIAAHSADLYVLAVGTNDVRYREKKICALDTQTYIDNIDMLIKKVQEQKPEAKFVLLSPWLALANDPYTAVPIVERDALLQEYGDALRAYSQRKGHCFINPNPAIAEVLRRYVPTDYLLDHIHPNAAAGIRLYSTKVLTQ